MNILNSKKIEKNPEGNEDKAILTHAINPIFGIIGTLIILLLVEDEYTKEHAKNSIDWQLSLIIYTVSLLILMIISLFYIESLAITLLLLLLLIALAISNLVFVIFASLNASKGNLWVYPITISFIGNNYNQNTYNEEE